MKLSGPSRRLSIFIGETDQLVIIDDVEVIKYVGRTPQSAAARDAGSDPAPRRHHWGRSS